MDPVSHALFGRLIAGLDRRVSLGPGSRAAFVLGALAPDLDIFLVPRGWDIYLNVHQAWTHSFALSPVVGFLVASVVRLVSRSARLERVWIAAWIGVVVGHLLFDLVSGSDMQLLWPVLSTRFSPHLLAMSDWLAVGIVVLATAASYRRRWLAAWLTVAAMALLLSVKAGSQSMARRAFVASVAGEQDEVASARPDAVNGFPFEWMFYDRQGRVVRAWRVNARTARTELLFSLNATEDEAAVAASRAVPAVATFLNLAHLPFPTREIRGGRTLILWSDPHYCGTDGCNLAFGTELGDDNMPLVQVIRIGAFEQTKPLSRESGQLPN